MEITKKNKNDRRFELDMAKFLAILFMIGIHVGAEFMELGYPSTAIKIAREFLGGPLAAPVFMFCMGIGIVYSRKSSYKDLLKRGLHILSIGYLLSFARGVIPVLLNSILSGTIEDISLAVEGFLLVDILQFAGLTFLFLALMKKYNIKSGSILAISLVCLSIGEILPVIKVNTYIGEIIGLLFWQNTFTCFPFFMWIVIPVVGYVFGEKLKESTDKKEFYKKVFTIGCVVFVASTAHTIASGNSLINYFTVFSDLYYKMNFMEVIWILSVVFIWISGLFFVCEKINSESIRSLVIYCSKNLNPIYITQWLLITYISLGLQIVGEFQITSEVICLVVTMIITILSISIKFLYDKIRLRQN